ncbi:MAG: hypothetical protein IJB86_01045 [Clostridia bacterium]|nr:hypothetical protein [Clostridia bacterium]
MDLLKNMITAFKDYPKLTFILVIAVILTVFVCIMAGRASSKMSKKRNAELQKIKEEVRLREKFRTVDKEKLLNSDCKEIIKGLTSNIQIRIEKQADIKSAFEALEKPQQYIYALNYVYFEDADSLSSFFRLNGKPLTTAAKEAFDEIVGGNEAVVFAKAYKMFDDDDETASVIQSKVEEYDKAFEEFDKNGIFEKIRNYTAEQWEVFNK